MSLFSSNVNTYSQSRNQENKRKQVDAGDNPKDKVPKVTFSPENKQPVKTEVVKPVKKETKPIFSSNTKPSRDDSIKPDVKLNTRPVKTGVPFFGSTISYTKPVDKPTEITNKANFKVEIKEEEVQYVPVELDQDLDIKQRIKKEVAGERASDRVLFSNQPVNQEKVEEEQDSQVSDNEIGDNDQVKDEQTENNQVEDEQVDQIPGYKSKVDKNGTKHVELDMFHFLDEEEEEESKTVTDDWNIKYKPKRVGEVVGNKKWVTMVEEWIKKHKNKILDDKRPTTMGMILSGPTGCGKTSLVYSVCQEYGYDVLEINPAVFIKSISINEKKLVVDKGNKPKDFISALIRPIMLKKRPPWERPTAILIEQADIMGDGETFFVGLAELLRPPYRTSRKSTESIQEVDDDIVTSVVVDKELEWNPPVFLTVNDPFVTKLKPLKKDFILRAKTKEKKTKKGAKKTIGEEEKQKDEEDDEDEEENPKTKAKIIAKYLPCEIAYMEKVQPKDIQNRLISICRKEGIYTAGIDTIADSSYGDLRKAVTLLNISARKLDESKHLDSDNVKTVCDTFSNSDVFSLSAERQAKLELTRKLSVNQLINASELDSYLTGQYIWTNIPLLIDNNYRNRPHPTMQGLHYIPIDKNTPRFEGDTKYKWQVKMCCHNVMDIMHEIEESWSLSAVFEQQGGWRNSEMSQFQETFEIAKPCILAKYPKEEGLTPFKLQFPTLGMGQQISKNDKQLSNLRKRTGIEKDTVGYVARLWLNKLSGWRNDDDVKKTTNFAKMSSLVNSFRDQINLDYFTWQLEKDNNNSNTQEKETLDADYYLNKYDIDSRANNHRIFKLPKMKGLSLEGEYSANNPFVPDEQEIIEEDDDFLKEPDDFKPWQEFNKSIMDMFDEIRDVKEKFKKAAPVRPNKVLDLDFEKNLELMTTMETLRNRVAEFMVIHGFIPTDMTVFEKYITNYEYEKVGFGEEYSIGRKKIIGLRERMKNAIKLTKKYGLQKHALTKKKET